MTTWQIIKGREGKGGLYSHREEGRQLDTGVAHWGGSGNQGCEGRETENDITG